MLTHFFLPSMTLILFKFIMIYLKYLKRSMRMTKNDDNYYRRIIVWLF